MSITPTLHAIPGGLLTSGFSERRARRKNLVRQFTSCDTALKNTSNPGWMRLPRMCRLTHDELERWAGRNVTGGRITGAKRFNRADWRAVGGTERTWVDRLVAAGWAEWEGDDLLLIGVDLDGEDGFVVRMAEKKLAGRCVRLRGGKTLTRSSGEQNSTVSNGGNTSLSDTAPAPATERSDLRSSSVREKSPPPPPPAGGEAAGAAGGGGGQKAAKTAGDQTGFWRWLQVYASGCKPEYRVRITAAAPAGEAWRTWAELGMTAAGVEKLIRFTEGKIREPMYARQSGRFRFAPGKYLTEVWRPELLKMRKAGATARGETGAAGIDRTMNDYLDQLRGEA